MLYPHFDLGRRCCPGFLVALSETTPQGKKKTKLNQTLLNGNNICMVGTLSSDSTTDPTINPFPSSYRGAVDPTNDLSRLQTCPTLEAPFHPCSSVNTRRADNFHAVEGLGYNVSNIVGWRYITKIYNQQNANAL